jgi:hypothetical protein
MSHHHFRCLFVIFLVIGVSISFAQSVNGQSTDALQSAIEHKTYTYRVQSVSPMKGGTRQLNPGYTLTVKGDTLVANLPYFGRVYQSSIGADGGFNFTSYTFDYEIKPRKKGGWNVSIKTKDLPSQRQFNLTVSKNGSTSLTVLCSDRESISYYGVLDTK